MVGIDTISMRAGTFRARHYRDRTGYGEQVDYWIDDSVGPIGPSGWRRSRNSTKIRAGFKFELVATGNDAVARITRPARPFDASVLKRRGLPGRGRRASAAAPGQGGPMTHVGRHWARRRRVPTSLVALIQP